MKINSKLLVSSESLSIIEFVEVIEFDGVVRSKHVPWRYVIHGVVMSCSTESYGIMGATFELRWKTPYYPPPLFLFRGVPSMTVIMQNLKNVKRIFKNGNVTVPGSTPEEKKRPGGRGMWPEPIRGRRSLAVRRAGGNHLAFTRRACQPPVVRRDEFRFRKKLSE